MANADFIGMAADFPLYPWQSLIHQHQQLGIIKPFKTVQQTRYCPGCQFMLSMIQQAVYHQVSPKSSAVSPQVGLYYSV